MNECLFQLCFSAYSLNVSDFQNPRPFRDRKTLPLRLCSVAQPLHGPQTRASDSSLSLSPHLEEPLGSWAMRLGADSAARGACTPALAPFINTPHLIASPQPPSSRCSDSTLSRWSPIAPRKPSFRSCSHAARACGEVGMESFLTPLLGPQQCACLVGAQG